MIEPSVALQTAVRAALIASPAVMAHVQPNQIRTGQMRKEHLPSIIMSNGQTEFLGHAAGEQYVARVWLDLHVWALSAGAEAGKAIAFAAQHALLSAPPVAGFAVDEFEAKHLVWVRDPNPEFAHGVLKTEAVLRWRLDGLLQDEPTMTHPLPTIPDFADIFEGGLA